MNNSKGEAAVLNKLQDLGFVVNTPEVKNQPVYDLTVHLKNSINRTAYIQVKTRGENNPAGFRIGGKKRIKSKGGREVTVPEKYDHFVVTTTEQGELGYLQDDSLTQKLMADQLSMDIAECTERIYDEAGNLVKTIQTATNEELALKNPTLKRILVALPFDDPEKNLVTSLALYDSDGCRCRGDAESADYVNSKTGEIVKVNCPCNMFLASLGPDDDPNQRPNHQFIDDTAIQAAQHKSVNCKANGNLRVMIAKAKTLGGIHQFRTTSLNSITQLMAAMHQVSEITGGILSAIPMLLEIYSKKVSTGPNKPPRTVFVVTLTHRAAINDFLREVAEQTALRESMRKQIAAKEILELPEPGREDLVEQMAISQEFYNADAYIDVESEEVTKAGEEKPAEDEKPKGDKTKAKEETKPKEDKTKAKDKKKEEPKGKGETKAKEKPAEKDKPKEKKEEAKEEKEKPKEEAKPREEATESAPDTEAAEPPEETPTETTEEKPALPDIDTKPPEDADYSKATKELRREFFKSARAKYDDDQIREWLKRLWDINSSSKLLTWQVQAMNSWLEIE